VELQRVIQLEVTQEALDVKQVQQDPLTLMTAFFEQATQHELTAQQQEWAQSTLQAALKEDDA